MPRAIEVVPIFFGIRHCVLTISIITPLEEREYLLEWRPIDISIRDTIFNLLSKDSVQKPEDSRDQE
jgi:hypothetical protein